MKSMNPYNHQRLATASTYIPPGSIDPRTRPDACPPGSLCDKKTQALLQQVAEQKDIGAFSIVSQTPVAAYNPT